MVKKLTIISVILFLILLPFSLYIDFYQNDDWVYYQTVENFLRGDYFLHPYSAPALYVQALLGTVFSLIFSIQRLPVLTLLATISAFFIFTLILKKLKIDFWAVVILGLVYLFNPLSIYSTWGFMTENYFMPLLLLSIYFFMSFEENRKLRFLVASLLVAFISINQRQIGLFIPLAYFLYYVFQYVVSRKFEFFKFALLCGNVLLFSYIYLENVFPQTPRMKELPVQFKHFTENDYSYALIYGALIYCTALLIPIFLLRINLKELVKTRKNLIPLIILTGFLFFTLNHFFNPNNLRWGEFPYFENTFERSGFLPRGIAGTKYHFMGSYDLYKFWDVAAKIVFSSFVAYLILNRKNIFNPFFFLIITYLVSLLTIETFYDRYLLVLIPLFIAFLVYLKPKFTFLEKAVISGFLIFLIFLNYQFTMDFLLINKYVWNKSIQLAENDQIERKFVQGTNAWKMTYRNLDRNYIYDFSYDRQHLNDKYSCCFDIIEEKSIDFPLSIWVNPKVYLYKIKQ